MLVVAKSSSSIYALVSRSVGGYYTEIPTIVASRVGGFLDVIASPRTPTDDSVAEFAPKYPKFTPKYQKRIAKQLISLLVDPQQAEKRIK